MKSNAAYDINQAFEFALMEVIEFGDWQGSKKEVLDYVVQIDNPTPEPDEAIVQMLDDWHGEDHFKVTAGWTFPEQVSEGLTGWPNGSDDDDYYSRLCDSSKGNQIKSIIEKIDQWGRINRAVAQVFQVDKDLNAMFPPCLLHIQAFYREGTLSLSTAFRSHTIAKSYLGDIVGLCRLQNYLSNKLECEIGTLTIHSNSLHIRKKNDEHKLAKRIYNEIS